jgi:hypothetical protein
VQREVDVEDDVEGPLVPVPLDQRGTEHGLQRLPIVHADHLDRGHGIETFGHRHRDPDGPELADEAGQDVEHGVVPLT